MHFFMALMNAIESRFTIWTAISIAVGFFFVFGLMAVMIKANEIGEREAREMREQAESFEERRRREVSDAELDRFWNSFKGR